MMENLGNYHFTFHLLIPTYASSRAFMLTTKMNQWRHFKVSLKIYNVGKITTVNFKLFYEKSNKKICDCTRINWENQCYGIVVLLRTGEVWYLEKIPHVGIKTSRN